jgi:uncharacterized Fe-S center protein
MRSKVYFSRTLTPENVARLYRALGLSLSGKVALKLHSGEEGNQNFLGPDWFQDIVKETQATVVECNTAYPGARDTSEKHRKLLKEHGWSTAFKVDLLDETGPDAILAIPDGLVLKQDYVGKDLLHYDSLLVVSHFKGHPMGGYGGALKQLSIGCASSYGKLHIHTAGSDKAGEIWGADHNRFLESMADAASAVYKHFGPGKIAFVSIMKNMSVDCDCCAVAEDPCLKDIGILSSLDPLAIDQACLDLVQKSGDPGVPHFMERVNSRHGFHTLEAAERLGLGSRSYELIDLDQK